MFYLLIGEYEIVNYGGEMVQGQWGRGPLWIGKCWGRWFVLSWKEGQDLDRFRKSGDPFENSNNPG